MVGQHDNQEVEDDLTINDSEILYRLLKPRFYNFDEDRPSSQSFQDITDARGRTAMSVFLNSVLVASGRDPGDLVRDHPGYGVGAIDAELMRKLGQRIVRVPDQGDDAHAHVVGVGKNRKPWKKTVPRECRVVVRPERPQ